MTTPTQRFSPCPTPFSDHVYKTVQGVDIPLRIWPATGPEANQGPRPWLLWYHGGGFIAGKHAIPNAWVVPAFRSRGYHVVSAAYRFIPHVNLDDIVTDTIDAHAWCRLHLADILAQTDGKVDIDALVVGGDSAGGTLSTLAGHKLSPPPRVVVDVFGVVDLTDPHMTGEGVDPDSPAAVMLRSIPLSGAFTAEQVATALAETDPSKAEVIAPWSWEMDPNMDLATLQSFWGMPSFKVDPAHTLRMDMLLQMSKDSSMGRLLVRPKDAAGHKDLDDSQVLAAQLRKWSSSLMLNDKDNYPPTFFLHGHKDRAVPIAQSQRMAAKLREMGIPTAEAYSPDGDHCFENVIERPEDAGWNEYIVPCMDFIDVHIAK